ncbi:MAG: ABC transporter permease [Bacteroidetes bacterium]|nr:MAG: ABC transporter permease [Bacteroidota bacterium]TAG87096.1 MAG: ABC transporter permease [Bacteroidota bacterium]
MLKNYIIVALRNLLRNRTYTALNVLGLALGLACGMIIFWFIRFQTTHDNFHPNLDKIYQVTTEFKRDGSNHSDAVPPPMSSALTTEMPEFKNTSHVAMFGMLHTVMSKDGKPLKKFRDDKTKGSFVHKEFFEIFNFPWKEGNISSLSKPNTIALTEKLATKYFGNENPMGRIIKYDNQLDMEVVGIVKNLPENTDLKDEYYMSFKTLEANKKYRYGGPPITEWGGVRSGFFCFLLIPKNVDNKSIEKRLVALKNKYRDKQGAKENDYHIAPYKTMRFNERYNANSVSILKNAIWIMAGIGFFLIVTACFNFINMATAQSLRRAKEVGIRKSIGGTKAQIFIQFMTETSIITFLALLLGFGLANLILPNINDWLGGENAFWQTKVVWTDMMMWTMIIVSFFMVNILAGTYPALILANFRPIVALKGSISSRQIGGVSLRRLLIIFQFILIQLLVICTLIMNNQFTYMMNTDVGYNIKGKLYFNIPNPEKINSTEDFRQRLLKIAGVERASLCGFMPTDGWQNTNNHSFDNRKEDERWSVSTKNADSHYIETFDLKLVAGKNFPQADTTSGFLVNEKYVEKLGLASPNEIVGKDIKVWGRKRKVYGVLKNWYTTSVKEDIQPVAIFSEKTQYFRCAVQFNSKSIQNTTAQIEKLWTEYYSEYVFEKRFLDDMVAEQYQTEKTMLDLVRVFSFIAIFIGCLGMYGLIKFMASQKTKEIGVRKTYGATVTSILLLFVKEILKMVFIAFVIATTLAWYLMKSWLESYPNRISIGIDVVILGLLITIIIATLTVAYESFKAANINPAVSLKTE